MQLAEDVVVVQVAADVCGGALVQLVLGGFDGLSDGAAFGQLCGSDGACEAGVYAAIFAGGEKGGEGLIKLVVGMLRGGIHCACQDGEVGRRRGAGAACNRTQRLAAELLFEGAVDVSFGVASGDGLAFVVLALAAHEGDLDFGEAGVVDIHAEGHDGPVALGCSCVQVIDLAPVEEEFAGTGFLVVGAISVPVLGDMDAHEPGFAIADENETFTQVYGAGAHRLDFGAGEGEAGLEGFFDEVVVAGFAICGDGAGTGGSGPFLLLFGQCQFSICLSHAVGRRASRSVAAGEQFDRPIDLGIFFVFDLLVGALDHNIRFQSRIVDGAVGRRIPEGDGDAQQAIVAEGMGQLHAAFAKGCFADQCGAFNVLKGAGDDFAGAGAAFVDEYDDGQVIWHDGIAFGIVDFFAAVGEAFDEDALVFEKDTCHSNGFAQEAARVAAQVEDEALCVVGQERFEFVAQLGSGIGGEAFEGDVGELVGVAVSVAFDDGDIDKVPGNGELEWVVEPVAADGEVDFGAFGAFNPVDGFVEIGQFGHILAIDRDDQVAAADAGVPGRLVFKGLDDAHCAFFFGPFHEGADAFEAALYALHETGGFGGGEEAGVLVIEGIEDTADGSVAALAGRGQLAVEVFFEELHGFPEDTEVFGGEGAVGFGGDERGRGRAAADAQTAQREAKAGAGREYERGDDDDGDDGEAQFLAGGTLFAQTEPGQRRRFNIIGHTGIPDLIETAPCGAAVWARCPLGRNESWQGDGMERVKLERFYHRGERQGERQGPGVRDTPRVGRTVDRRGGSSQGAPLQRGGGGDGASRFGHRLNALGWTALAIAHISPAGHASREGIPGRERLGL